MKKESENKLDMVKEVKKMELEIAFLEVIYPRKDNKEFLNEIYMEKMKKLIEKSMRRGLKK